MFGLRFFFFFKQKTAYELRISDWSSDVCSSDLADAEQIKDFHDDQRIHRHRPGQRQIMSANFGNEKDAEGADDEQNRGNKIGRASCRARVCQYGVDLGGRRSIKKKNEYT